MAQLAAARKAVIRVSTKYPIHSSTYVAATAANNAILKLATELTGDPNALIPVNVSQADGRMAWEKPAV